LLERYIAEHPELALQRTFVDNGETGVDYQRPAWNDLMRECRAGTINCIVIRDLSRLGRNYIETGELLEKILPMLGVRLISVNDRYDNLHLTHNEQLVANLKNLINDIYAKDISKKVSAALRTKQQNGDFIGNFASYGYLKDDCNKNKIVVDPETAPIVRQIFKWKAECVGNSQICRRLNDAGVLSPSQYRLQKGILKDKRYENILWQVSTIINILENPCYLGKMVQGRHIGSLAEGKPRGRAKLEDCIIVDGTHEPIVTQELFDTVQAVMKERTAKYHAAQGKYAHFEKHEKLLKGLIFCADCGLPLTRYKSVHGGGKHCDWVYICRTNETLKTCPQKYIHEEDLNRVVYDAIRLEIEKCANIKAIIEKLSRQTGHKSRLAGFDAEIENVTQEIKRIAMLKKAVFEDYATKLLTADEYQYAVAKYDTDTDRLKHRLSSAKAEKAEYAASSTPINKWLAAFSRFMDDKELSHDMAKSLIQRIEISDRNKVTIVFKFRDEFMAIKKYVEGVAA
jgi:DNA invertase Pin-like site-specific DNA recombinase